MKERPILFKPHMVGAILKGEKTQTRREEKGIRLDGLLPALRNSLCPYGRVGDVLWVRETWWSPEKNFRPGGSILYRADDELSSGSILPAGEKWRPSIFMPKIACRLYLEITGVRAEKLQDISEEDAKAEGTEIDYGAEMYRSAFKHLWMSINGAQSWFDNPYVWVITFKIYDHEKERA